MTRTLRESNLRANDSVMKRVDKSVIRTFLFEALLTD
jgi:hypothetical protein